MLIGQRQTVPSLNGEEIIIETGKLAKQADGSVVVRHGNTMILAAVVANKDAKEGIDFLPLTVEYREKYSATGKFPGGYFKREARPTDNEILTARLIDRALRPLFPDDFHADTQMVVNLISSDKDTQPDALACLAASAALAVSNIPFNGPTSEVRVGRINGKFVINPKLSQMADCDMDIMVAATAENIMMVEGEMAEVSEKEMLDAIKFAHEEIKLQCQAQLDLAAQVEKAGVKRTYEHEQNDADLKKSIMDFCYDKCYHVAIAAMPKHDRSDAFKAVKNEYIGTLSEEEAAEKGGLIGRYFHDVEKEAMRNMILNDSQRLDGRKLDEIRPIWSEVDYLPGTHGSAVFTRGETQSLTTVTLGTKLDQQTVDGAFITGSEKFMLHYNFPPYSTGEARPIRGVSRREIGHGNLALRALKGMIPTGEDNPYTVRVVSEILESNGSSSMATVCAGTLALMDAGIKIKKPVSGIAMGLIMGKDGKFSILSDILGDEDHLGDMDFKVTGTADGITACQMDIKVDGLSYEIMEKALDQAKAGRHHILGEMLKTMSEPRADFKPHVPRIETIVIDKDQIGAIIGPGGKIIQEIQAKTLTTISITEVDNKGIVEIACDNLEGMEKAKAWINGIVAKPEIGTEYTGRVKNVVAFGAFVEILPGKEGLLHISEIDWKRIENVEDVLKTGDQVKVKLVEIDAKSGKLRLSRKVLMPKPEQKPAAQ
ncbi:MAG: polyribonucleotide nucleotidyltransferase [Salibacteraceae bacterium]|nr:polyribonucleotide nucleotidyltransferase [Salibacteraceae bacterium]MDP4762733.1 polyribonucleotide nucleotidyltransferase [Salibacteraceae bacterium]MDP4964124.1 polyribonucleotide nucleotidyltransferase [Salibacteraceae bacterium]